MAARIAAADLTRDPEAYADVAEKVERRPDTQANCRHGGQLIVDMHKRCLQGKREQDDADDHRQMQ